MVGAAKRYQHYLNRMVSSLIDPVLAAVNTAQSTNFQAYTLEFVPKQQLVHQYLDAQGCMPVEYFNYNAFCGEIYHIFRNFSGAAAIAGAADMVIKYTGMGCTVVRLKAIALIFNIVVP